MSELSTEEKAARICTGVEAADLEEAQRTMYSEWEVKQKEGW